MVKRGRRGGPSRGRGRVSTIVIPLDREDHATDGAGNAILPANNTVYAAVTGEHILSAAPTVNGVRPSYARIRKITLDTTTGAALTTAGMGYYQAWRQYTVDPKTDDIGGSIINAANKRPIPGSAGRFNYRNFPRFLGLSLMGVERQDVTINDKEPIYFAGVVYPDATPKPAVMLHIRAEFGGVAFVDSREPEVHSTTPHFDTNYGPDFLTRDFLASAMLALGMTLGVLRDGVIMCERVLIVRLNDSEEMYMVKEDALTEFRLPYESFMFPARDSKREGKVISHINEWCRTPVEAPGGAIGEVFAAHSSALQCIGDFELEPDIHEIYVREVFLTPQQRTAGEVLGAVASGGAALATMPVIPQSDTL